MSDFWIVCRGCGNKFDSVGEAYCAQCSRVVDAHNDWHQIHEYCAEHIELLRPREQEFIGKLGKWYGRPTEKQFAWLCAIFLRLQKGAT